MKASDKVTENKYQIEKTQGLNGEIFKGTDL